MLLRHPHDVILILGDSITEFGYTEGGFVAKLAADYVRKLDVVNRGYAGYNTDLLERVVDEIMAPVDGENSPPTEHAAKIVLIIFWMGANDSVLPDAPTKQHVPLERYKSNILTMLQRTGNVPTILITPPPIQPERWRRSRTAPGKEPTPNDRDVLVTQMYSQAVIDAAQTDPTRVKALDVGTLFQTSGKSLDELLVDGLHCSPTGYEVVYQGLKALISKEFTHLASEWMPLAHPSWDTVLHGGTFVPPSN